MTINKYRLSGLALLALIILLGLLFTSSATSYQDQSLVQFLTQLLPNQPFKQVLAQISFSYGGEPVSIQTSSYYHFIEFFIRKGAHFTLFGTMAILIFCTLWSYIENRKVCYLSAVVMTFGFASFDELHQVTTLNRSGMMTDVFLDTCGAIFCLGVFLGWQGRRQRARRQT